MAHKVISEEILLLIGVVVLAVCIIIDISIAYVTNAKWIPGNAVVIYALFLQLVGYLDVENASISKDKDQQLEKLLSNQLSIYSSRLVLFVFVGYLVPHLASTKGFWANIAALFASLSTHIAIELSAAFQSRISEKEKVVKGQRGIWLIVSSFVMLASIFYFSCLIGWAISRGKFIRDNLSSRIPLALEARNETSSSSSMDTFKSEMLKSWIIARVSQPEYVLGRSFFSLEVACLVTTNVLFMGMKLIFLRSQLQKPFPLFAIQCIFIALVWFLVCYRCFIRYGKVENVTSFQERIGLAHSRASVCDIFSLMRYVSPVFVLRRKILKDVHNPIYRCTVEMGFGLLSFLYSLPSLIYILGWLGAIVILFVCRPMIQFRRTKFFLSPTSTHADFAKYKEALDLVCMPGDEPESLWVANEKSFNHMKNFIWNQAYEKGRKSEKLQKVMGSRLADNIPLSEDVKELLEPLERVRKYFPLLEDSFRRITATVLLMDDSCVPKYMMDNEFKRDVRKAFKEAEELMDFLDCPDNVGISLDFFKISNLEAFMLTFASIRPSHNVRFEFNESSSVADAVEKLRSKAQRKLSMCKLLGDPSPHVVDTDWCRAAEDYAMYKVCKLLEDSDVLYSVEELQSYLINIVSDLIAVCVTKSPKILLECSRKWAAKFREDKISAAMELAGFACGVIDGVNEASLSTKIDYADLFSNA